jgi:hypothetical protein
MSRRAHLALWGILLALALALRLPALTAGLPYPNYVDERFILNPAARLLRTGHWDPGAYVYPSLPLYATAGALSLYSPLYRAVHGHPLKQDLSRARPRSYGFTGPVEIVVAGRFLTLCASLGIVVLTGLLARCLLGVMGEDAGLFGGSFGGWLAALLAALVPALVIRGAVTSVDPWATFFTLAALLFAERAVRTDRPYRDALLAGVMTGCAATSKYTVALAGLAVAATLLRVPGDWHRKARAVEIAVLASMAAAVATMPALILKSRDVLEALAGHAAGYAASTAGSYWDQAVRRAEWDLPFDGPELGALFLACAALGWLVALRDRRYAGTAAAWTLYAVAVLALFTPQAAQPFRNLLPLVPLACILVALFFVRVGEALAPRWRPWAGAAAALLVLTVFLPALIPYALERSRMVDSRVEAVDWLLRHRRPEETLLVSAELAVVAAEIARLPGRTVVMPQPQAVSRLTRRRDVRFILTGSFRKRHILPILLRGETGARYRRVAIFGGRSDAGRAPSRRRIVIYQRIPAGTPPARISRVGSLAAGGAP